MNAVIADAERTSVETDADREWQRNLLEYLVHRSEPAPARKQVGAWSLAASMVDARRTAVTARDLRGREGALVAYVAKTVVRLLSSSAITLDALLTTAKWPTLPPTAAPRMLPAAATNVAGSAQRPVPTRNDLLALARAAAARRARRAEETPESIDAWAHALANGVADRND